MKLDLNFALKGLDGKEIGDSNAGKLVGNTLVAGTKGDALKYYDWGRKLYAGEALEIDRSDLDKIKTFIQESEAMTILAKAQIIEAIDLVK